MSLDLEKLADLRVKHLELIQGVVARMAANGANAKTACVTLVTAVTGFGVTLQRPIVVLLALVPVTIFAGLDAQYLRLERQFRRQFDRVRGQDWSVQPDFGISAGDTGKRAYFRALSSWSIVCFYLPIAVAVIAGSVIAGCLYGKFL